MPSNEGGSQIPMRSSLLLMLASLVTVADSDAVKKDLDAMQGEWVLKWGEIEGRKVDFPPGRVFSIRGNKWHSGDRDLCLLKVDPTSSPKVLDMMIVDKEDGARGQT